MKLTRKIGKKVENGTEKKRNILRQNKEKGNTTRDKQETIWKRI